MRAVSLFLSLALCCGASVQAQNPKPIHYEDLEVGTVIQGGIGLGIFTKPFPMPPGQWTVVGRNVSTIPLVNSRTRESSGSISKYDLTLKSGEPGGMLPAMVLSITGRLTNLDPGTKPCNPSTSKTQWTDTFSDRTPADIASSGAFVCASSVGVSNFKKVVADAATSSNAWVKSALSPLAPDAYTLPDNAVMVNISASRYRGYTFDVVFFVKQEGNLSDPVYAAHLQPWIHATGLSLLTSTDGSASSINLPVPFAGSVATGRPVAIDNRVQSTFTDVVPVADIRIRKTFELRSADGDNLKSSLLACIPQFGANFKLPDVPMQSVVHTTFKAAGSSKIFIAKNSMGLCLQSSSANFPIFAAEAFSGTVAPVGVSDEVVSDWNAEIARLVATKGVAQVAYQYPNQGAMSVKYWVDASNPIVIRYATEFKAQGAWVPQTFDAVFADTGLTAVQSINVSAKGEGKKDVPF